MKNFLITHPLYKKILLAAIWLILVCGIVIVLKKEISPVIAIDSLTVSYPDTTLEILPGATMEEDIAWDRSTLESIDLAFSYTDDVWQDTQVKVSVFRDDAVIMEQVLSLTSLPADRYVNFCLDQTHCAGSTFTVRVENLSDDPSSTFRMLCTDNAHYYLDSVSDYRLDGKEQNSRLLCQMYYIQSYSFYKGIVGISWLLLLGIALSVIILRLPDRQ